MEGLLSGLVGALLGGCCTFGAAAWSARLHFTRTARNSLKIIRHEISGIRLLLEDRLHNPHKFQNPDRELFEIGFYGDPTRLAPMYISLAGQIAEYEDFLSEEVVHFYSKLLNLREGASATAGHIFYARKSDIMELMQASAKALEHIDRVLKG